MELKSRIFCRYGSSTIIHPKISPNIDKSTFKCTHCNKIPTNLDIPQFQSNDSWYDQENNEEPRQRLMFFEKASALVAATDHGGFTLRPSSQKLFPRPMSNDSNKLQQALMADGSEGEKKSLKFGCGIDVWDMLPLVI
ncbi:hypothetical protein AAG906_012158 [Vitis piasezkii]